MVGDDQQLTGVDLPVQPRRLHAEQKLEQTLQNETYCLFHLEPLLKLHSTSIEYRLHLFVLKFARRRNRFAIPWDVSKEPRFPESLICVRVVLQQVGELLDFADIDVCCVMQNFPDITNESRTASL